MKYYFYRVINKNELHDKKDSLLYYNQDVHESYINKHLEINYDNISFNINEYTKENLLDIEKLLFHIFIITKIQNINKLQKANSARQKRAEFLIIQAFLAVLLPSF